MTTHSPDWYNEQYNNRARVSDCQIHLQNWADWSAISRLHLRGHIDVAYGPTPGQKLDVFEANKPHAPIIVFIHGGYWRSLDKSDHSFIAPPLIDAGALPVMVNYDLAPEVSVSEICLQMEIGRAHV